MDHHIRELVDPSHLIVVDKDGGRGKVDEARPRHYMAGTKPQTIED